MQIFKTTRAYILTFLIFVAITFATVHAALRNADVNGIHTPTLTKVAEVVGMLCCAIVVPQLISKTSVRLEKTVIIVTELICVIWLVDSPHWLGAMKAEISYGNYASMALICAAAVLAGVRLIMVVQRR